MAQFTYRARTSAGNVITAVIEAIDQRTAIDILKAQKMMVLEIGEIKRATIAVLLNKINPFKKKIKSTDLVLFSRQLSTLVSAGMPIVQGLGILHDQVINPAFKTVINGLRESIESGISIADSMEKYPQVFSELYVSMIRAGELGGILDTILERISNYMEASEALKGKIKSAMTYPIIVALIAVGAVTFLLTFVIPKFAELFSDMGAPLPLPTRMLIAISALIKQFIYLVIGIPVGGFITLRHAYRKSEIFRLKIDTIFLNLPIIGILIRKLAIAKFTRTLSTLVKSGVPILQSLDTVAKTSGNKVIEKAIYSARESIREGEKIAEPLKKSNVFPPMVIQMIAVGEETGALDTMLAKISDFYDREVDDAVKSLTSMIEPLIIVFMGVVVGGIVLSLFLPMFEITSLMSQQ